MYDFPVRIINSGHSECSPAWTTRHEITVPFFRVYYVDAGFASVRISGEWSDLVPGNVYFIPGLYPFLNKCPEHLSAYWFHGLPMSPSLETFIGRIDKVHSWKTGDLAMYKKTLLSLDSIDLAQADSRCLELQSLITYLLAKMSNIYKRKTLSLEIPSSIRKSINFMDSHYIANPPLRRIAANACLSPNYFNRIFKKYCGTTPHGYMERKRMETARTLLASTDKTLAEITETCGYESFFYFSRVFKKHFRTSPGEARKQMSIP